MKTAKSIVVVLFVLLTAQIASAYYCPSTGRWLSRDPIGEPGFQALQMAVQTSPIMRGRWINRDSIGQSKFGFTANNLPSQKGTQVDRVTSFLNSLELSPNLTETILSQLSLPKKHFAPEINQNTVDLYCFVRNDPIIYVDNLGLDCSSAPPLSANCAACDAYGNGSYMGASLKCFCKCAGDSPWAQKVRGCLACEFKNGTPTDEAHKKCYAAAGGTFRGPDLRLIGCWIKCQDGGGNPPLPYPNPL